MVAAVLPARRSRADAWALVIQNQGLARAFAARLPARMAAALGGRDDAQQIATLGLFRASAIWDESRGVRFGTFAWACMRTEIARAFSGCDPIRIPTSVQREERARLREELRPVSLSRRTKDDREHDLAPVAPDVHQGLDPDERAALLAAIDGLPEKVRRVVREHFLDGASPEEIGRRIGHSGQWVRQLAERGLARLREKMGVAAR
jgi:RNA polymerase sigma factor (sigma-70 family)